MDLRETYNRIAASWHAAHANDDWWIEGTNSFAQLLQPGASVLDIGCGSGMKCKYFCDRGFKVLGIDISDAMIEIAKREAPRAEFKLLSMADLDSIPDTFDAVFAQASLLHIPKKDAGDVVMKMARRVAKDGLLYIAVKEAREGMPDEQIMTENDYGYDYERFFSFFTMDELEEYLRNASLEVVSKVRNSSLSGKTVWLQIVGKK